MKENILLRRRTIPQSVRLPNDASFLARYERVSRRNLPSNVRARRTRTIGPKNRRIKKKRATFADTALLGNMAKSGVNMGAKILFK